MAEAWSTSVPSSFQQNGFQYSVQPGIIRSDMETGPAKIRRRFTGVAHYYSGSIIMTKAEFETFESWFENTVAFGSLDFTFPDPFNLASNITVRFKIDNNSPYTAVPEGNSSDLKVSFALEKMP